MPCHFLILFIFSTFCISNCTVSRSLPSWSFLAFLDPKSGLRPYLRYPPHPPKYTPFLKSQKTVFFRDKKGDKIESREACFQSLLKTCKKIPDKKNMFLSLTLNPPQAPTPPKTAKSAVLGGVTAKIALLAKNTAKTVFIAGKNNSMMRWE